VELVPRAGARVAQVSAEHASDLYATRLLVEPPCIRGAVEAMTADDAQALDDLHNLMEAAIVGDEPRAFLDHNVAEVAAGDVLRQALEEMLAAFEHRAAAVHEERRPASGVFGAS
jgi:DNA-binding FadR family transcriptional regulator